MRRQVSKGRCSLPYAVTRLFESAALGVADTRCRPDGPDIGAEEVNPGYALVFPRTGSFVRHVARERLPADPTHVLLFTPDRPYRVSHPVPGGDVCTNLLLSRDQLRELVAAVTPGIADDPSRWVPRAQCPTGARADLLHRGLVRGLSARTLTPLGVEELGLVLAGHVLALLHREPEPGLGGCSVRATAARHRALAARAQEALAARLREPIGLGELAREVGCSPYHLCRVFRREVGLPAHRYQVRLRLRAALAAVADGARDLTGLALDLGFADHSHLTHAFTREVGVPPSAWRCPPTRAWLATLAASLRPGAREVP